MTILAKSVVRKGYLKGWKHLIKAMFSPSKKLIVLQQQLNLVAIMILQAGMLHL